jgi:phosphomannomutase
MRAGFRYMNDLTVLQATQGLVRYLGQESVMPSARKRGIVVGYDARHNSRAFADIVGRIFAADGFRVFFFSRIVPTPFVPFAITVLKACAGVMITASHNPKDDNGYKLYWENACQINAPHDKEISRLILANQEPWPARVLATRPCSGCLAPAAVVCLECDEIFCPECDGIVHNEGMAGHSRRQMFESEDPTEQVATAYYQALASPAYCREPDANATSTLRITYTPMHGVGKEWAARAFTAFKLPPYVVVPEQIEPDPDFPTVPFPNPEEGKGALHLAMKTADATGCSLIVANDPDADRLAVAEKLPAPAPSACSCGQQEQVPSSLENFEILNLFG